jgi:hypothetical protein
LAGKLKDNSCIGSAAILSGPVEISGAVDDQLHAIRELSVGAITQAAKIVKNAVLPCSCGDFEYDTTVVGSAANRSSRR